jgi:hypothetical protein
MSLEEMLFLTIVMASNIHTVVPFCNILNFS